VLRSRTASRRLPTLKATLVVSSSIILEIPLGTEPA
jgi:hypothetical protein